MRQRYSDSTQLEVVSLNFHSTFPSPHCDNHPIGIGWAQLNCSSCENIFLSCIKKHSTIRVSECVACNSNWKWRILWQTYSQMSHFQWELESSVNAIRWMRYWIVEQKDPTQIYLDVNTKREWFAAAVVCVWASGLCAYLHQMKWKTSLFMFRFVRFHIAETRPSLWNKCFSVTNHTENFHLIKWNEYLIRSSLLNTNANILLFWTNVEQHSRAEKLMCDEMNSARGEKQKCSLKKINDE